MRQYSYRVMIAVSMLLNVLTGGELGQTLSARQHQRKRDGKWNLSGLIDAACGKAHCNHCWSYWKVRKW